MALSHDPSGRLQCIKEVLILSGPALDYDYRQLIGQITGRMATKNSVLLQEWLNQCRNVAITCLIPNPGVFLHQRQSTISAGSSEPNGPTGTESKETCISAIYRLASDHHAAALSTVKDEMTLWDFRTGHRDKGTNLKRSTKIINQVVKNRNFRELMINITECVHPIFMHAM